MSADHTNTMGLAAVDWTSETAGRQSHSDTAEHPHHTAADAEDETLYYDAGLQSDLVSALGSRISGVTPMSSIVTVDSETEAMIRSAAREVVAMMERQESDGHDESLITSDDDVEDGHCEDSHLEQEDDPNDSILGSNYCQDDEPCAPADHQEESASSHHSDDVFSDHSARSSVHSVSSNQISEHGRHKTELVANDSISQSPTRASSTSPYSTLADAMVRDHDSLLPRKSSMARPLFRTPSAIRAMQMSSPNPSVFLPSSPKSMRVRNPTASRLGTPTARSKLTPRFKPKKEYPLVLLHVKVLQSTFAHATLLTELEDVIIDDCQNSSELLELSRSWRLLQDKIGEMVLERGVLLPHPQDDFEVLEERLLETLELPIRPRAMILGCGHYIGNSSHDLGFSDEDESVFDRPRRREPREEEKWCETCNQEVRLGEFGPVPASMGKMFRVKVYASNGLMGVGAWAAAWREMERVDVEIEPLVTPEALSRLEGLAASLASGQPPTSIDVAEMNVRTSGESRETDGMVQMEINAAIKLAEEAEVAHRRDVNQARFCEVYGVDVLPSTRRLSSSSTDATHPGRKDEQLQDKTQTSSGAPRCGSDPKKPKEHTTSTYRKDDSLPDLLLAALKIALRDRKNVLIVALGFLVILLALRSPGGPSASTARDSHIDQPKSPILRHAESLQSMSDYVHDSIATAMNDPAEVATEVASSSIGGQMDELGAVYGKVRSELGGTIEQVVGDFGELIVKSYEGVVGGEEETEKT